MRSQVRLCLVMLVLEACGGVVPWAVSQPSGSEAAKRLCAWQVAQHEGIPCATAGVGETLSVGEITFRFDAPLAIRGDDTLPAIRSLDERADFHRTGGAALALPVSLRNDSPVRRQRDTFAVLYTASGATPPAGFYNTERWLAAQGQAQEIDGEVPPGAWVHGGNVYAVPPDDVDAGLMWIFQERREEVWDPERRRNRVKVTVVAGGVVDLGPATRQP